jgi:hypothetical protein
MSVLDDFARMRLYRARASGFEFLADAEQSTNVRLRFRIIARHYRDLADREEQADKARMADRLARLKLQRQQTAAQPILSVHTVPQFFLEAAE